MLQRLLFACALLVLAAFPGSAAAQSGTYDLHWVALCGPDAFNPNTNAVSVQRGELRIIVEQMNDGTTTFWAARNASTGAAVWDYAVDGDFGGPGGTYRPGQVQDLQIPGVCATPYFGSFEWNPAGTEDGSLNFHVYNGFPASSREAGRFHAVGIRAAAQQVTPTVTLTAPTGGQVLSGTTPIRATTTGFTGSRQYQFLVDGVLRQTGTITTNSFTLWFNTTRVANGTHTFTLRITQGATTATASVQVTVSN